MMGTDSKIVYCCVPQMICTCSCKLMIVARFFYDSIGIWYLLCQSRYDDDGASC